VCVSGGLLPAVCRVEAERNRLGKVTTHLPYPPVKFQPEGGSYVEVTGSLGSYFRSSGGRGVKESDWQT